MTAPAPDLLVTCLIVDDSPPFLEAARQLLADDLGTESGFDVAQRLAGLPHGGPAVILISAESGSELAELVDASGTLGFVSKTDLSGDAIRKLLARAESGG